MRIDCADNVVLSDFDRNAMKMMPAALIHYSTFSHQ
jgi:hypothetical protein